MRRFLPPASLARRAAAARTITRGPLVAIGLGLASLGLALALDDFLGPPTNRPMAEALGIGG